MRASASPGPGGSMVNSSTTPASPGSRAMTPRATIDPLPLLAEDSATGLLLISYRGTADFWPDRANSTPFPQSLHIFQGGASRRLAHSAVSPLDAHLAISYDPAG